MAISVGGRRPQTLTLKILRDTVLDGNRVFVGDIVKTSSRYLVNIGKAVEYVEPAKDEKPKREKLSLK